MSGQMEGARWADLATAGFVHVKGFLSEAEIVKLRNDYGAQLARATANGNYDVPTVSPLLTSRFEAKLQTAGAAIKAASGIDADMTVCGLYFATEKGISFSWHQDHESFFIYQQHAHYLNFYIPVVKPERGRSNLCLVPFDDLKSRLSDSGFRRLVGSGASRFVPAGERTVVYDDERGDEYVLPLNIEELKVVPELEPGDLLLMRGDMIHRTQDTETLRISVSFRRTRSGAVISKARLISGAATKQEMIRKNAALYAPLLDCFTALQQDEMTAKQLTAFHVGGGRAIGAQVKRGVGL